MSSRVIKKLGLGERDVLTVNEESDGDDNSSSMDTSIKTFNRYNLLNDESHSESEVKEDDDRFTEPLNTKHDAGELKDDKKRRKKKKKKKQKVTYNARSSEDNYEDEVDRSMREIGEMSKHQHCKPLICEEKEDNEMNQRLKLLHVQPQNLNPNNELKWIFGSKVLHGTSEYGFSTKPRKGASRNHLFKTVLSTPKDNWAPYAKTGLTMSFIETKNGLSYFKYEYSDEYRKTEEKLRQLVSISDLDSCVLLVHSDPYHVNVLLQISQICIAGEDYALGCELLERALYSLEHSFHSSFNILQANCRLDYNRKENRCLFIALFKYMLSVAKRSCYKTALDVNKVLLGLDPEEDPTACILSIDYYAIKARDYKWLIGFIDAFDPIRNLMQLPSFMYSKAIAYFYMGETEKANEQLIDALLHFPLVVAYLISKHSARMDPRIGSHTFFSTSTYSYESKSLTVMVDLYLERTEQLLKDSSVKKWLETCALHVLDMVDKGEDTRMKEYRLLRLKRYRASLPLNVKRHLVLSNLTELYGGQRNYLYYDPVPPPTTPPIFNEDDGEHSTSDDALTIFFRAFLPGFNGLPNDRHNSRNNRRDLRQNIENAGPVDDSANQNANNEGAVEVLNDNAHQWRQSFSTLIDSVRDLLTNFEVLSGEDVEEESDGSATNDNSSS